MLTSQQAEFPWISLGYGEILFNRSEDIRGVLFRTINIMDVKDPYLIEFTGDKRVVMMTAAYQVSKDDCLPWNYMARTESMRTSFRHEMKSHDWRGSGRDIPEIREWYVTGTTLQIPCWNLAEDWSTLCREISIEGQVLGERVSGE
jgi:hypothetical protein